jgi:hypothetical protein
MNQNYKCRLTNRSEKQNTRTPVIEGFCEFRPTPGERFVMWNDKPLTTDRGMNHRMIATSEVMVADFADKVIEFHTESGSTYLWEDLS